MKIKFSFFFAWYDAWIGLFFDQKKRILYICPLPCCVFKLEAVEHSLRQTGLSAAQKDMISGDVKESPRW